MSADPSASFAGPVLDRIVTTYRRRNGKYVADCKESCETRPVVSQKSHLTCSRRGRPESVYTRRTLILVVWWVVAMIVFVAVYQKLVYVWFTP